MDESEATYKPGKINRDNRNILEAPYPKTISSWSTEYIDYKKAHAHLRNLPQRSCFETMSPLRVSPIDQRCGQTSSRQPRCRNEHAKAQRQWQVCSALLRRSRHSANGLLGTIPAILVQNMPPNIATPSKDQRQSRPVCWRALSSHCCFHAFRQYRSDIGLNLLN